MTNQNTSICTRCGKVRSVSKVWTEEVEVYGGVTVITRTTTVCPDPECQELVNKDLQKQTAAREEMKKEAELRAAARNRAAHKHN